MNEDYIIHTDIKNFVQAEVDRQSGEGINTVVAYDDLIDVSSRSSMEKEDWIEFGEDVAKKVERKFNKVYELESFDRFSFVLRFERDLEGVERYI